jgi:hypothetical protein
MESTKAILKEDYKTIEGDKLKRICLHKYEDSLQTMLINMPPNFDYPFIRDDINGQISYCVVKGSINIEVLWEDTLECFELEAGESLYLERRKFRRSYTKKSPCIYIENLSGGHAKDARIRLNK